MPVHFVLFYVWAKTFLLVSLKKYFQRTAWPVACEYSHFRDITLTFVK